jgi:hypothetical protein
VAPPVPDDEAFIRVWDPLRMRAFDEWVHADLLARKHWKLPDGYTIKDGAVWHHDRKLPRSWAARHLAGCIEIPPDVREFGRRSYMVPLDTYELYESRFEK